MKGLEPCRICKTVPPCRCTAAARRGGLPPGHPDYAPPPAGSVPRPARADNLHRTPCPACAQKDAHITDLEERHIEDANEVARLTAHWSRAGDRVAELERQLAEAVRLSVRPEPESVRIAVTPDPTSVRAPETVRLCVVCNASLAGKRPDAVVCSPKCRAKHHRQTTGRPS
jgi:hypothetical protein